MQAPSKKIGFTRRRAGARTGAGRPTREQAELRHEELLDYALQLFLDKGYEQTTIDGIALAVGMTKRTLYARYEDKSALFKAAVQRAIDLYSVPIETLRAAESDDLESTLINIARIRVANVMTTTGIRLQRILNAESYRFPDIFNRAFEQGAKPTIDFLADVLRRHNAAKKTSVTSPERAASAFMSMVVGGPTRLIVSGKSIDKTELEERIRFSVRLFLNGALRR
jgi:TetR/AcrR family transcriptional regulator, mexJK operon transcriptional repressor